MFSSLYPILGFSLIALPIIVGAIFLIKSILSNPYRKGYKKAAAYFKTARRLYENRISGVKDIKSFKETLKDIQSQIYTDSVERLGAVNAQVIKQNSAAIQNIDDEIKKIKSSLADGEAKLKKEIESNKTDTSAAEQLRKEVESAESEISKKEEEKRKLVAKLEEEYLSELETKNNSVHPDGLGVDSSKMLKNNFDFLSRVGMQYGVLFFALIVLSIDAFFLYGFFNEMLDGFIDDISIFGMDVNVPLLVSLFFTAILASLADFLYVYMRKQGEEVKQILNIFIIIATFLMVAVASYYLFFKSQMYKGDISIVDTGLRLLILPLVVLFGILVGKIHDLNTGIFEMLVRPILIVLLIPVNILIPIFSGIKKSSAERKAIEYVKKRALDNTSHLDHIIQHLKENRSKLLRRIENVTLKQSARIEKLGQDFSNLKNRKTQDILELEQKIAIAEEKILKERQIISQIRDGSDDAVERFIQKINKV